MLLDILAWSILALIVIIAVVVLLLFILLVVADSNWKEAWPLLAFAALLGGFVWALIRLGVM
jgi:hypothetical protein